MKLPMIARILLGVIFTVFGLNGFLQFMPDPGMPPEAGAFMGALGATGYFFPLLKLTETVCGILLLSNKMVPLALTVLAPVVLNIILFHIFLFPDPAGIIVPILNVILLGYLAYTYRSYYTGVLTVNAKVDTPEEVMA